MTFSLHGKTVIITGASEGVGAAAARLFYHEGSNLVLAARQQDKLEALATELGDQDRILVVPTDVSVQSQLEQLVSKAKARFSSLHVLVNNAGFNQRGPLMEQPIPRLNQILDVNLKAPLILSRLMAPHIKEAGGGAIINVASIAGITPMPDEATYCATKFGLRGLTFSLADELAESNITVSAVSPGPIDTGFIMSDLDAVPDYVFSQPMSTPEQVAELILQCAKDGRRERTIPKITAATATLGYHIPALTRWIRPLLDKQGARKKSRYQT